MIEQRIVIEDHYYLVMDEYGRPVTGLLEDNKAMPDVGHYISRDSTYPYFYVDQKIIDLMAPMDKWVLELRVVTTAKGLSWTDTFELVLHMTGLEQDILMARLSL